MNPARSRTARMLLPLLLGAVFAPLAWSAPYPAKGRPIHWTQPDGTELKLRVFGDDFYGRTETEDGFTVVYNQKTRAYHYATVSADGLRLKPAGTQAHRPQPRGIKRHLDRSPEGVRNVRQRELSSRPPSYTERWQRRVQSARARRGALRGPVPAPGVNPASVTGYIRGLTILAQFPDDKRTQAKDPVDFPTSRSKIVRFCNNQDYSGNGNEGSVRDYFFEQSDGMLTYTQTVTEIVTLPRARNYYNFEDYPTNTVLRDAGDAGNRLIKDAIQELQDSNFDFSGLTTDALGNILATNVFFAGEDSGVWPLGLWPHQFNLDGTVDVGTATPMYVNAYQITNLPDSAPVIGTFCHENGHLILDYPDLYDYGGESEGVGEHCLMGSGNFRGDGKIPAPINVYFKDIVGWANITDLSPTDYMTASLPSTGNVGYRLRRPGLDTEYFMVENRGDGDPWAADAIDKGIAIWHVDETISGNDDEDMTEAAHYQVSLEQADGSFDLERGLNRGDSRDLFDKGGVFSSSTNPDSNWWNGRSSDVRIKVLGKPSKKVKVQFGPLPPNTIIVGNPSADQVLYRGSSAKITWEANIEGDLKIDLYRNGKFDSEIVASTPNSGSYVWTVPSNQKASKKYTVRISTLTNPKPVFDDSDNNFTVTDSTFPESGSIPFGWFTPDRADKGWKVSKSEHYEGKYSLSSGKVSDGDTAAIAYRSNFKAGNVTFYLKVSSETGFDVAKFYIDGVAQRLGGSKKSLSGNRNWKFVSVPVSAGRHTLMWTYEKDESYGDARDKAWLDAVELPPMKQEIAVRAPSGSDLTSDVSSVRFTATKVGRVSEAKTFTIKNTGKSDLTGLGLKVTGPGKKAFLASGLRKKGLKPGQSTTFKVRFAPKDGGPLKAKVRVLSNDADEDPFLIEVKGTGKGQPKLTVSQPADNRLKDGKDTVNFGIAPVGGSGRTLTFTVRNKGSEPLRLLGFKTKGSGRKDFKVAGPADTTIDPGNATTFEVMFQPTRKNRRAATLIVQTNDPKAGSYSVDLKGKGAPRSPTSAVVAGTWSASGSGASAKVDTRVSAVIVEGGKYRTLTVRKDTLPTGCEPVVEVSPNLLDWFRGPSHTTVLRDDGSVLKVRDNTPLAAGVKRHIRLRMLDR